MILDWINENLPDFRKDKTSTGTIVMSLMLNGEFKEFYAPSVRECVAQASGLSSQIHVDYEAYRLIQNNELVAAIKYLRIEMGWGLKEAKDYTDNLKVNPPSFTAPTTIQSGNIPALPQLESSEESSSYTWRQKTRLLLESGLFFEPKKTIELR